jgi:threonine aldolase
MLLHLDGARLSNAAAALGKSFKEFTTDVGVDLVSLGGTKIGAMAAEAVIVINSTSPRGKELAEAMPFLRKTSMQLPSKMRFVSAQLSALFENNAALAIANGKRANGMAQKLYAEIVEIAKHHSEISLPNVAEANAVFPILPQKITEALQAQYRFYVWNQATGQVRLMCSWDTQEEDVNGLVGLLRELIS